MPGNPTLAYAAPDAPGPMTRNIDEAARGAGRDRTTVRWVYNISGRFSGLERGFLDGPPEIWVSQLTDLVLEYGFSAFVLGPGEDPAGDLERFALEVAPGVREAVAAIRRGEQRVSEMPESIDAFPPALSAVLNRLGEEHEIIAEVVEQLDLALVAMMTDPAGVRQVRRVADELGDALLSHLAYEENELVGPLGRSSVVV